MHRPRYGFPLAKAVLAYHEAKEHYESVAANPKTPYAALAVARGNFRAAENYLKFVEDCRDDEDGFAEYEAA